MIEENYHIAGISWTQTVPGTYASSVVHFCGVCGTEFARIIRWSDDGKCQPYIARSGYCEDCPPPSRFGPAPMSFWPLDLRGLPAGVIEYEFWQELIYLEKIL